MLNNPVRPLPGRHGIDQITSEQAALRKVAMLVARGASPEEVLAALTEEAGRLLGADHTMTARYDPDGEIRVVAAWSSSGDAFPVGTSAELGGRNVHTMVFQAGQAARIDDYAGASGPVAEAARELGLRAGVGVPVSVEGRLRGVMAVDSRAAPLPEGTEARLAGFTELAATAMANAQALAWKRADSPTSRPRCGGSRRWSPRRHRRPRCSPPSPRKPGGCCTPVTRRWAGTAPTAR